jgi:undecaprenyl diphosphate synthase
VTRRAPFCRRFTDAFFFIRIPERLSNFLLWQLSHTQMYVIPKLWTDFTKKDLFDAFEDFGKRNRRYGAV